jgi:GNAT superfamily N-acetyltransferase
MASSDAIDTLRPADLEDAGALVREAGWNQTAADWRMFMELGTTYAVRDAGRVIATAATLPYGSFAWVSMVLVAGEHRRHGLGTRLLSRAIDDLTAAGVVPVLDATPAGRALYLTLGFEDAWSLHRLTCARWQRTGGTAPAPAGTVIHPISDAVLPKLCAYDAAAFGADRSGVLARLRGRLPVAELVAQRDGRVTGFALGRDGRTHVEVGPLVAEDDATACALLARALDALDGPIYIDLADAKTEIRGWLEAHGFAPQRPYTRMLLGRSERFDDAMRTYALAGPELG